MRENLGDEYLERVGDADNSSYQQCDLTDAADNALFHPQQQAIFAADKTKPISNVVFCPTTTGTPASATGQQKPLARLTSSLAVSMEELLHIKVFSVANEWSGVNYSIKL